MHRSPARSQSRGLTLVEACIGLSVLGVLAATAAPSFEGSRQRVVVEGLAAEVATDLRYVRSEAVSRNQGVRISFYPSGSGQCYVIHTGDRSQCSCGDGGVAQCGGDAELIKSGYDGGARGVALVANVGSMLFNPGNGTTVPGGTVCMVSASGSEVRHVVSIMGRVRTCTPPLRGTPCGAC